MSKHLIVGAITGYREEHVSVFINSLNQTGYQGETVFFLNRDQEELAHKIKRAGFQPEYFETGRFLNTLPHNHRFIKTYEYLLNNPGYDKVFITDTRDVLFQKDPFGSPLEANLYAFLESPNYTLGTSDFNAKWIKRFLGRKTFAEFKAKRISCCGTVMGTYQGIISYLEQMLEQFYGIFTRGSHWYNPLKFRKWKKKGMDTAFHNYIVHNSIVPHTMLVENGEIVLTMAHMQSSEFELDGSNCLVYKSNIPLIVHQYDRFKDIDLSMKHKFGEKIVTY